jgi:hypothetical protein
MASIAERNSNSARSAGQLPARRGLPGA